MDDWAFCPRCGSRLGPTDTACDRCGATPPTPPPRTGGDDVGRSPAGQATLEELTAELREALAPGLQLLRQIGQGGMGTLYLARDPALKRDVAVKVLSPEFATDATARARFAREAESAAAVTHPHVVSVYQVGELPRSGTSYFVMQYVEGQTLGEAFPEGGMVPEPVATRIIGEVASALAAAHARELVHRDIKPSNIMIDAESGKAVVLDFGISAAIAPDRGAPGARLTVQGISLGTPAYMSPEQAAGEEVTSKSDVYSLGLVAFELVTGRAPFEEQSPLALVAAHLHKAPPRVTALRPELEPQLADLIDRALAKEPAARPSADEIARALVPEPQPAVEWPPPGLEPLQERGRSFVTALRALALALFAAFLGLSLQPRSMTPQWYGADEMFFWQSVSGLAGVSNSWEVSSGQYWLFLLVFLWFLLFWRVMVLGVRSQTVATSLARARRSGYPWTVLADVTLDRDPDTKALLNRAGRHGSLTPAQRDRFVVLRRRSGTLGLLASLAAILTSGLWMFGTVSAGARTATVFGGEGSRLLPVVELLAVFGVSLGLLGWSVASRLPEHRHRRRVSRRKTKRGTLVRRELVDGWMESVGRARRPAGSRLGVFLSTRAPLLAISMVGVVLLFQQLSLLVTILPVHQQPAYTQRDAKAWMRRQQEGRLLRVTWPEVDSIVGLSVLPRQEGDPLVFRQLTTSALQGSVGDTVLQEIHPGWDVDLGRMDSVVQEPRWLNDTVLSSLWREVRTGIPDTLISSLARDTTTPKLALFRTAAVTPPPPLWQIREGFPELNSSFLILLPGVEIRRWEAGMLDLAIRNEAAALLHLAAGDPAAAERRGRETISVGHALVKQPVYQFSRLGRRLVERGARVLTHVGEARGDAALLAEGVRLTALFDSNQDAVGRQWSGYWLNVERSGSLEIGKILFADPVRPPGLAAVGDTTLAPFVRWELVRRARGGYCSNAREVLFGIDPRRRTVLDSALVLAADLPRIQEWGDLLQREFELLLEPGFGGRLYGKLGCT